MNQRRLTIDSDGVALDAGACLVDEPRGMVVLLHGIPQINPDPDDPGYPDLARVFAERGWSALWAGMRGTRGSEGFFSIEGWVHDAVTIVQEARELQPDVPFLALVGSSAGGVVSVEAVRRGAVVDAIALLAAPAAWVSFAGEPSAGVRRITEEAGMPLAPDVLDDPTQWAAEFDAVSTELAAPEIKIPLLLVHGTADTVVPVDHVHRIADAAPEAELVVIEGAEHQLRRDERALDAVFEWLERVAT